LYPQPTSAEIRFKVQNYLRVQLRCYTEEVTHLATGFKTKNTKSSGDDHLLYLILSGRHTFVQLESLERGGTSRGFMGDLAWWSEYHMDRAIGEAGRRRTRRLASTATKQHRDSPFP